MGMDANHLTTKAYSERTGIPAAEVAKRLREGRLNGRKHGGRWWIPVTELDAQGAVDTRSPSAEASPEGDAGPRQASPPNSFSVAEFSQMTFLTEFGVLQWLRNGRLIGSQAPSGEWRVDADNLDVPNVRRLLR